MRGLTRRNGMILSRTLVVFSLLSIPSRAAVQTSNATPAPIAQPSAELTAKDIALIVSSILAQIVALAALFVSLRNTKAQLQSSDLNAEAQRWKDANQKEIERLDELLRTFHVPYLVRSEANNNMAQDLRDRFKDPNYRMLVKLFDPNWLSNLSPGDQALVKEVCQTGIELRRFIEESSGGVDSCLTEHLARASTHFRILSLACAGKLGNDPKPFERYVYPRALDPAIRADLDRISQRLSSLRAAPSRDHGIMKPLTLPADAQLPPWPNPVRHPIKADIP